MKKYYFSFLLILSAIVISIGLVSCGDDDSDNYGGVGSELTSCSDFNHPHLIDLGLPSGTKWACCNVGALAPEQYGRYYAWGETQTKSEYNWSTYIHCDGSPYTFHNIGSNIAGTSYDVATVDWGTPWRMPSLIEIQELLNNTTSEWTTVKGVHGRKFTGPNGGTIFLPAVGWRIDSGLNAVGSLGYYWSSSLYVGTKVAACRLRIGSGHVSSSQDPRYTGLSVRPVVR